MKLLFPVMFFLSSELIGKGEAGTTILYSGFLLLKEGVLLLLFVTNVLLIGDNALNEQNETPVELVPSRSWGNLIPEGKHGEGMLPGPKRWHYLIEGTQSAPTLSD